MKTNKITFSLLLSLLVSSAFASTNTPVITHASLELRDGSKVVGVFTDKTLPLTSASLGDLKLPVERIRSVEWPTDKPLAALSATNGDKFSVELRLTDLPLTSSFGDIKVPVAKIRSVRFWTDNGETPRLPGLVALWSAEGDARDAVSGQTGTVMGGVSYVAGKVGQAFSFNGADSCVSVPSSSSINFSDNMPLTITTWVYRTSSAPTGHILGKRNGCYLGEIQYQLAYDEASGVAFIANGGNLWVSTHRQLPVNTWQQVAVTYNGTSIIVYIDGQSVASGGGTLGPAIAAPLKIGNSGSCQTFTGSIDEVSFYNRALSADEIRQLFDASNAN